MIDYTQWSQEYESQALKIKKRIDELLRIRSSGVFTLTIEEVYSINKRLGVLRSILYEHRITAKTLKERGVKYAADKMLPRK